MRRRALPLGLVRSLHLLVDMRRGKPRLSPCLPQVYLLPAPAPPPGQTCIDPQCMLSIGWGINNGTIAFAATCNAPGTVITWCGFGLSPSGNMIPSEAFVLQASGGNVVSCMGHG